MCESAEKRRKSNWMVGKAAAFKASGGFLLLLKLS